jgi:hypothetical protein
MYISLLRAHPRRQASLLHIARLQRKLKEERTTFKKLVDETRRDLALQYIRGLHGIDQ